MTEVEKPRVLIVDDNSFNIGLIRSALYPEFKLMVAHSGKEALRIATERKPDLVLLDVLMPDLDGYAVCAEVKKHHRVSEQPGGRIGLRTRLGSRGGGFSAQAVSHRCRVGNRARARAEALAKSDPCTAIRPAIWP